VSDSREDDAADSRQHAAAPAATLADMDLMLNDKVAVVTGASKGIGLATALTLRAEGAKVAAVSRSSSPELSAALDDSLVHVAADLSTPEGPAAAVDLAVATFGGLDILVNNAGVLRDRTLRKMTLDDWRAVMDTNLDGVFHCCKFGTEILRDGGRIVNIASVAGLVGFHGQANYAAAKAGVIGMTRVLGKELARRQITVNAVAPGVIQTPMLGEVKSEVMAEYLKQIPAGRLGTPDDIANAVLFLASEESGYITGQVLPVTGGWI
jgi:3-oxoacyl-[acyl-carrier protein] reductase